MCVLILTIASQCVSLCLEICPEIVEARVYVYHSLDGV
jgi:hypothetical protein